jgi:hypothetical protein
MIGIRNANGAISRSIASSRSSAFGSSPRSIAARNADFCRREDPANDPESARLAKASQQTFAQAAELLDIPARPPRIPYEDTTLPGHLFLAEDSGEPRPTVI